MELCTVHVQLLSGEAGWKPSPSALSLKILTQRAQYPLIKEYTLSHKGIHIMI